MLRVKLWPRSRSRNLVSMIKRKLGGWWLQRVAPEAGGGGGRHQVGCGCGGRGLVMLQTWGKG